MILIADAGATKTDWALVQSDGSISLRFKTGGINVAVTDAEIADSIIAEATEQIPCPDKVEYVFFYGAGIVGDSSSSNLAERLALSFPCAAIECNSDLLAAARALFGNGDGVVAIMGTGSNACEYRNGRIVRTIASGGYILGDEGGANALGRRFLADYIKGLAPDNLCSGMDLPDYPALVRELYHGGTPARYLASFAKVLLTEYGDHPYVKELVNECVEAFVSRALSRFDCKDIAVVGSFGVLCRDAITAAGERYGLSFVKFMQAPMDALVDFHSMSFRDGSIPGKIEI